MILVSLGSEKYNFDRLLKIIDELCDEKVLNGEEIIAQIGATKYESRNYKCFGMIPHGEYKKLENEADYIIAHAGTGSIMPALKTGKKIIMFPRLKKYGEHIDDHQLELNDYMAENGYALTAKSKEDLQNAILQIQTFTPKSVQPYDGRIDDMIIEFLEE